MDFGKSSSHPVIKSSNPLNTDIMLNAEICSTKRGYFPTKQQKVLNSLTSGEIFVPLHPENEGI